MVRVPLQEALLKTLLTVMCHREVQATVDRHMPYWLAHKVDLIFLCPNNSVIETTYPVLAMERSSHSGTHINRKFRRMLEFWLTMDYERFLFFEYDALLLSNGTEILSLDRGKLHGNLFTSDQKEFKGHYFLHPPILVYRPVLEKLVAFAKTVPDETDRYWDRWLGYVCEYGNIPFTGYGPLGFARNTINPEDIPAAVEARRNGSIFFHGVKSDSVLQALLKTQPIMSNSANIADHGREL